MQNTQVSGTDTPAAGNMMPNMTEGSMGRLANFNAGVDGYKTTLSAPKVTNTDITSDIR